MSETALRNHVAAADRTHSPAPDNLLSDATVGELRAALADIARMREALESARRYLLARRDRDYRDMSIVTMIAMALDRSER